MKKTNILIFPAGTEIGLEIHESLRNEKNLELFGGTSSNDFTSIAFEDKFRVELPFVNEKKFIATLIKECDKRDIELIIPAHDEVINVIARNRTLFSRSKIKILVHPKDTSIICRSKLKTYKKLEGLSFLPKYEIFIKANKPSFSPPYFLKPITGQGSKGILKAETRDELTKLEQAHDLENYLICELLPGKEYTVDCFTNFKGELVFCEGRVRDRTTNGISVSTFRIVDKKFKQIASEICSKIPMNGAWFFQVKRNARGKLILLEVGARIAGSSTYARYCGINLSLLNIYNIFKENFSVPPLRSDVLVQKRFKSYSIPRFAFDSVYFDLDDTLIVDNRLNRKVMNFLIWCLNNKKAICLITRHKGDLKQTLKNYRISELFDQIIHIQDKKPKADFMKLSKAIFIDDSFAEREAVRLKLKIPVYSSQTLPEIY